MNIAASTYYARQHRPSSAGDIRDEQLTHEIRQVYKANYAVLGARKMQTMLNRHDPHQRGHVARCTVGRLMGAEGISGLRRTNAPNTTHSAPREKCPADLVDRHFASFWPDRLWVADITYVRTFSGWVYVAFVIDVFSRMIVGWQCSTSLYTGLAEDALKMGIYLRKRQGVENLCGLIHHSDRGVQYRSIRYGNALDDEKAVASVGSKGDSFDNALAEATNSLYKDELIRNKGPWTGIDDLEIATAEWVHWFNTVRPHGSLSQMTPTEFEAVHPNGRAPRAPVIDGADAPVGHADRRRVRRVA
ncbi:Putative integrase [Corynebacterium glyciniphilum AJ 3170]|uniref:Putative integrase n=1 Tax=Corynebacterium glyciniphilum AJ 3170 TaxID=1404245 RepID=X5EBC4_9CORY|nr:Putative integrase [Corynebacterium glyciniphilum AJ 3170]